VYGYDANRNLTSIAGTNTPWYSRTFEYDELDRLVGAAGRYGVISYAYDDGGNRLSRSRNGVNEGYTYQPGTNSLEAITGGPNPRTFTYDENGNIIGDGTLTFIYDQNNRLTEVKEGESSVAVYTYNGLGQRVKKIVGEVITLYHYDLEGKLIAEGLPDGTITREYLYMGKVRMAMIEAGAEGEALYHYLNDRLGTPEILTDAAGTVVWEAWYEPFGEAHIHPSSKVVNNHRFPGQYYDAETGLHYNYHRYYDPRTGRYITPDPIGQRGGINLHLYASNNPVNSIDQEGLIAIPGPTGAIGGSIVGFLSGTITGAISGAEQGGVVGAIGGAVGGGLAGMFSGAVGGFITGGLGGGITGAVVGSLTGTVIGEMLSPSSLHHEEQREIVRKPVPKLWIIRIPIRIDENNCCE
jgi:RHS repeat-associated protein